MDSKKPAVLKLPSLGRPASIANEARPAALPSAGNGSDNLYQQRYGVVPPQTLPQPSGQAHGGTFAASRPGGGTASSSPAQASYSSHVAQGNAILVNRNQQGNPLLKCLRNINYRHADVIPDYQINDRVALLFLSLRYHKLKPMYIHGRIAALQKSFRTFLLCKCDVDDPMGPLADVTKIAIDNNCTLLVGWSDLECARYLEILKSYENKPPDSIKPRLGGDYVTRLTSVLTTVRAVNKTDVATMGAQFGSLAELLAASPAELANVPGLGPTKVRRLADTFTAPFLRAPPRGEQQEAGAAAANRAAASGGERGAAGAGPSAGGASTSGAAGGSAAGRGTRGAGTGTRRAKKRAKHSASGAGAAAAGGGSSGSVDNDEKQELPAGGAGEKGDEEPSSRGGDESASKDAAPGEDSAQDEDDDDEELDYEAMEREWCATQEAKFDDDETDDYLFM